MCGMFNQPRKTVVKMLRILEYQYDTYLATLKIGRNNAVKTDILNEEFLKSDSHVIA